MTPRTDAEKRAQKAYISKFERVEIRVTPEQKARLEAHTAATGESVNAFINRTISETIERDNRTTEGK